jgi:cyclopropane-fatty-acyl-phospholipid synthase
MWEYYLAYCEAGFRAGALDVGLYRIVRPSDHAASVR